MIFWIIPIVLLVLLLIGAFMMKWIGNQFLENLRRLAPGEAFNTDIDVSFYEKGPMPKLSAEGTAFMKTLPMEEVEIHAEDGCLLHGYLFPAEGNPKRYVLGIHGFHSDPYSEYGPHIAYYRSIGWGMLLVDDRAHGKSEGSYVTMGVKDSRDCVNWANFLVKKFGEEVQILLHGVSMGGATVLSAAGEEDLPKEVLGVVSDCGFTSAADIFANQIGRMYPIPTGLPVKICGYFAKKKAGFDLNTRRPIDQVKHARVPIVFIHGAEDTMVPVWMSEKLYEACTSKKKLLKVAGANHAESVGIDPDGYHKAIEELLEMGKEA